MHYHIVGIAGAGMSAIANMLLDQGHTVSGSDLSANRLTAALAARGATLHVGHDPAHVSGADVLLATSAVQNDHPELAAAQAQGIALLRRSDVWREWSRQRTIIAVAGTHGKTTTTAMIAWVLTQAGREPGFLVGSESPDLGTNARWGDPHAPLVIEADEYDRAFLALTASIAVITNVEWDHPDIYPDTREYQRAFAQFALEAEGPLVTCGDGKIGEWSQAAQQVGLPLITYGLEATNDYQALLPEQPAPTTTSFRVRRSKALASRVHDNNSSAASADYHVGVPGLHNICNALAAIVVADIFGLEEQVTAAALQRFRGTARRFELKGEAQGITVIDDYAHHPTEVRATLAAARARYGQRRIVAYVQPHTFSRTQSLLDQWPAAFAAADVVLVGAIYAAREHDTTGAHRRLAQQLADDIAAAWPAATVSYAGTLEQATAAAHNLLQPGDVLLTMGAGDSHRLGETILTTLETT